MAATNLSSSPNTIAASPPPPNQHRSPPPGSYDIPLSNSQSQSLDNAKPLHLNQSPSKEDSKESAVSPKLIKLNPYIDDAKREDEFVKKKLMYHLQTRPERQKLVNLNILRAFDKDPALSAVMDNLMKQRLRMLLSSRILDQKLSNRKSIQSLIREGILKEADEAEEEEKGHRRDMYRRMSNHSLTEFLSRRPTLQELVKANMVQDMMTWHKISCSGTIPRARNCHQMCLDRDDTTLYLVGGFNTGSVSIDLLKCDIQNQKWSRPLVGGPVPPERYCHSVVNIDSNLIVFGGFSVEGKWLNDLHALDTEYAMNSEFQAFVPRLSPFGQCKASTNNSQMLLWYPPETTGTPPSPRAAHAACVVGKSMYVFGGNNCDKLFNDLYCLDTANMKWSLVTPLSGDPPTPRANHSLTAIGDKYLIVFGGNDGQPLNDIHIFDIEKCSWSQPKINGTPPLARGGHSAVCIKNKQLLIFAGGYNSKILNDLYILDVETMTWIRPSDTGMLPEPRAGHSCCVTKNNVVYICGGGDSENDKLFNDLYQLDTGYFTTDEKQISKLIYHHNTTKEVSPKSRVVRKGQAQKSPPVRLPGGTTRNISSVLGSSRGHRHHNGGGKRDGDSHRGVTSLYIPNHQMSPQSTSPTAYDEQGQFRQNNFMQHAQNFVNRRDEQYGGPRNFAMDLAESPLMAAGVISDDIASISQEIDVIINTVELGIKHKINEFKQKEQGYIMILRSIEAERSKLIDDVNRDVTMLKFSVKESLDKLQQKFIAKMLRKHVDYVTEQSAVGNCNSGSTSPNGGSTNLHKASVQVPLRKPSLGVIQEEQDESKEKRKDSRSRSRSRSNSAGNVADDEKVENVGPEVTVTDSVQDHGDHKMQEIQPQQSPTETAPQRKALTPPRIQKDLAPNSTTGTALKNGGGINPSSTPTSPPLNGSIPESSQSPNPTRNVLRQQEDGQMSREKEKGSFINQALKRQAEFQQNQSMAQYYVKVAEYQNQQIAQRAQAQQQQFAAQNGSNPQWWQSGFIPYPNGNGNGNGNGSSSSNGKGQKKNKKRRRKKRGKHKKDGVDPLSEGNQKRISNGLNSNGQHSNQPQQVAAVQNMTALPTISMLNGVATLSNGNLFATNGLPNGIQYSDSTLFQQFTHSQPPQFQPTLSPPTNNNNTLNGNAASYQ